MSRLASLLHDSGLLRGTDDGARGLKTGLLVLAGLVFVSVELFVWLRLVPGVIGVATAVWLTLAILLVAVFAARTAVNARATRSIAHVLYDVEHPSDRR